MERIFTVDTTSGQDPANKEGGRGHNSGEKEEGEVGGIRDDEGGQRNEGKGEMEALERRYNKPTTDVRRGGE